MLKCSDSFDSSAPHLNNEHKCWSAVVVLDSLATVRKQQDCCYFPKSKEVQASRTVLKSAHVWPMLTGLFLFRLLGQSGAHKPMTEWLPEEGEVKAVALLSPFCLLVSVLSLFCRKPHSNLRAGWAIPQGREHSALGHRSCWCFISASS